MPEPIISVSGLRGIVGQSLTPEVAVRYALAFESTLLPGTMVLTFDGRESGPMFLQAIAKALADAGREVLSFGAAATPTTGVLVQQLRSPAGGIQISASHNPAEYNGLKLFSAEGRVIPAKLGDEVIKKYRASSATLVAAQTSGGKVFDERDSWTRHIDRVLKCVDADKIRARGFRVLLDSNHGAGSIVGSRLLAALGIESTWDSKTTTTDSSGSAILLGAEPHGRFEHLPEPTAENLGGVLAKVREFKCDVGFCQDPDADRLALIDENGRYIGEEYTLAICAKHILSKTPGPVVTNCSTSRMTEDIANEFGVPFYRSAVGEANVVDTMLKHGAIIGGEGNGGLIDPRVVLVRDSFTAMAIVLAAMAERELPLSTLADELPRYEICKTKMTLDREKLPAAFTALEKHFGDAASDRMDGLRLDWPGKWLLVRGSNTEPIVRSIAEAPTAAEAERLCKEANEVLAKV
jgi:phosphomannomutase